MTYKKIELLTTEQVTPLYLFTPPAGYVLVPGGKFDQLLDLTSKLTAVNNRSHQIKDFCVRTMALKSTTEAEKVTLQSVLELLEGEHA